MKRYEITYSDGTDPDRHNDAQSCIDAIKAKYPDGMYYYAGQGFLLADDANKLRGAEYILRHSTMVEVWKNKKSYDAYVLGNRPDAMAAEITR